jgi:hypothetical protein
MIFVKNNQALFYLIKLFVMKKNLCKILNSLLAFKVLIFIVLNNKLLDGLWLVDSNHKRYQVDRITINAID